ncbi:MAG: hypothetical protein DRG78_16465 [Epsilonproteobacteria bacterium]|nr:MAG: hypothetical protein DRG78_16465 [Campylobacterota bacterium]
MKSKLFYIISLLYLLIFSGCYDIFDEDTRSSDNIIVSTNGISGKAIDGYIKNATVNIINKQTGDILLALKTKDDGSFNFDKPDGLDIIIEISGGIDSSTGEAFTGIMKNVIDKESSDAKLNVTPLTSLVAELVISGQNIEDAQDIISSALGIDTIDLNLDPIEVLQDGTAQEKVKAAKMMKSILIVQKFSEVVSSISSDKKSASANVFLSIANKLKETPSLKLSEVMDPNNTDVILEDIKDKLVNELDKAKLESIKELTKNTLIVLNQIDETAMATSNDVMSEININASAIEVILTPLKISLKNLKKATTTSTIIQNKIEASKVLTATIALGGIEGISKTLETKTKSIGVANFAKSFLTKDIIDNKSNDYTTATLTGKTIAQIIEENKDKVEVVNILDFGSIKGSIYIETTADAKRDNSEKGLANITIYLKDELGIQEGVTDANGNFEFLSVKTGVANVTIDMSDPDFDEQLIGTKTYNVDIVKDKITNIGDKAYIINNDPKAIDPSIAAQCENPISFTWDGSTVQNSTKTVWENLKQNPVKTVDINGTNYSVTLTLSDINGKFNEQDSGTNNDKTQTYDDITNNGLISKGIFGSPYLTLYLGDDKDKNKESLQKNDKILLRVDFNKPVILDNWLFRDIDSGDIRNNESGWDWQDAVKIVGYDKSNNPIPMSVIFSEITNLQNDNGIIRTRDDIQKGGGSDTTDSKGHAKWSSNGVAIDYMIVEFSSGSAIDSPTRSAIAASGFSFCPMSNKTAPTLIKEVTTTILDETIVDIIGIPNSDIYINNEDIGQKIDEEGKASITLNTSGEVGKKIYVVKSKKDGQITKPLYIEIKKLLVGAIEGSIYKESTNDTSRSDTEIGLPNISITIDDGVSIHNIITNEAGNFTVEGLASGEAILSIDIKDPDIPEGGIVQESRIIIVKQGVSTNIGDIGIFFENAVNIDPSTLATCDNPISFTWYGSTVPNSTKTEWKDIKNNLSKIVTIDGYNITLTLDDVSEQFNNLESGTSGIFGEPYFTLYMGDDSKTLATDDNITLKVEFDKSVILDNWLFRDIDSGDIRNNETGWDWQDAVKIVGYDINNNKIEMKVQFSQTTNLQNDNGVVRTEDNITTGDGTDTIDPKGHAKWSSNEKSIKYLIVTYSSGKAIANPTRTAIAASGFSFCPLSSQTPPSLSALPTVTISDTTLVEINAKPNSIIYINDNLSKVIIGKNGKAMVPLNTSGTEGQKDFTIQVETNGIKSGKLDFSIEKVANSITKPILESFTKLISYKIPNNTVVAKVKVLHGENISTFTLEDSSKFIIEDDGTIKAYGDLEFNPLKPYTIKVYAYNGEKSDSVSITFNFKEYLLDSQWNQLKYYNKVLPVINNAGAQPPVGCVQVTLGQILNYHKSNKRGNTVLHYKAYIKAIDESRYIKAVLNRNYNWDLMPDKLDKNTPVYQVNEVSYLLRDLIAVNKAVMSKDATGAALSIKTIPKLFNFSTTIQEANERNEDISREFILNIIKEQIESENPIEIAMGGINGGGHSFILDGYKEEDGKVMVHLNLGWGGLSDGWYDLSSQAPLFGSSQGQYDLSREFLKIRYNIKPCDQSIEDDCYKAPILEEGDSLENMQFIGNLNESKYQYKPRDIDLYEIYLKGKTILSYKAGVYAEILNDKMVTLVEKSNNPIDVNLTASKYFIRFSQSHSNGTSSFVNSDNHNVGYTYDFNTTFLDENEIQVYKDNLGTNCILDMNLSDMIIDKEIRKVYIYAYDEDNNDTLTYSATSTNDKINLSFDRNILIIDPQETDQASDINVTITSTDGSTDSKAFKLLVTNNKMIGSDYKIEGMFKGGNITNVHTVPLKGECIIKLNRTGLSTSKPYAYLQLINNDINTTNYTGGDFKILNQAIIDEGDTTYRPFVNEHITTDDVVEGSFKITAGLTNRATGSGFSYTEGLAKNNYSISISCPAVSNTIEDITDNLGISNSWSD